MKLKLLTLLSLIFLSCEKSNHDQESSVQINEGLNIDEFEIEDLSNGEDFQWINYQLGKLEGIDGYRVGVYLDQNCEKLVDEQIVENRIGRMLLPLLPGKYYFCASTVAIESSISDSCQSISKYKGTDITKAVNNGWEFDIKFNDIVEFHKEVYISNESSEADRNDLTYNFDIETLGRIYFDRFGSLLISANTELIFNTETKSWLRNSKEMASLTMHYWYQDDVVLVETLKSPNRIKVSKLNKVGDISPITEFHVSVKTVTFQDGDIFYTVLQEDNSLTLHSLNITSLTDEVVVNIPSTAILDFFISREVGPFDMLIVSLEDIYFSQGEFHYTQDQGLQYSQLEDSSFFDLQIASTINSPISLQYAKEETNLLPKEEISFFDPYSVKYCSVKVNPEIETREVVTLSVSSNRAELVDSGINFIPEIELLPDPVVHTDGEKSLLLIPLGSERFAKHVDWRGLLPIRGETSFVAVREGGLEIYDFTKFSVGIE